MWPMAGAHGLAMRHDKGCEQKAGMLIQVLLVTGATGVMMASYVVPVVNHLMLYFGK